MKGLVVSCAPLLRQAGFRKRRFSFNRSLDGGLTQVVEFRLAPSWSFVSECRPAAYQLLLGIYVPEMATAEEAASAWVRQYECQLSIIMGELAPGDLRDPTWDWWRLGDREPQRAMTSLPPMDCLGWVTNAPEAEDRRGGSWPFGGCGAFLRHRRMGSDLHPNRDLWGMRRIGLRPVHQDLRLRRLRKSRDHVVAEHVGPHPVGLRQPGRVVQPPRWQLHLVHRPVHRWWGRHHRSV